MQSPAAISRASLLLALVSLGCVSPTGPRDTAGWFEARGADLLDVLGLRVALGPGLGAYVRVTEYAQLGLMLRGPSEARLPIPEDAELRAVRCFMFGTIGRYGGAWFEATREYMLPGWSSRDGDDVAIEREVVAGYVTRNGQRDRWRGAVGVGLHALLVGVEAELRPLELLDFVGGLVGYDPSGDDVPVTSSEAEETSAS